MVQYKEAIKKYGENSVALSNTGSKDGFSQDWSNMAGEEIKDVLIMMHGKNQSINVGNEGGENQITSTGDSRTNLKGTIANNVQDLLDPKGNISNATLFMYSCHSADSNPVPHGEGSHQQGPLTGTKMPIAKAFATKFKFKCVIGTADAVNYNYITNGTMPWNINYLKPYPKSGKWIHYIRK